MKNRKIKITALALCAVLVAGGSAAYAVHGSNSAAVTGNNSEPGSKALASQPAGTVLNETEGTVLSTADKDDEEGSVVYIFADADGNIDHVSVKNAESGDFDKYTEAAEIPVSIRVSYELDGKAAAADELAGKSGHIKIRYEYTNLTEKTVTVNGKTEKVHVPFAVATGLILNNDTFSNIKLTNAKLADDGARSAVAAIVFPGLQSDLGIDTDKFTIPEYFEIEADVKDFSLEMTLSVVSSEIFEKFDTDTLDDISSLSDSLGELTDAMNQLINGSLQLYNGLCTLLEKSAALSEGTDKLSTGALQLKNGADDLNAGAAKLKDGASQIAGGLNTLDSNSIALNDGARQVFVTLLQTAKSQLEASGLDVPEMTIDNYSTVLENIISSLDADNVYAQALDAVTKGVEEKRPYIEEQVTEAVSKQVREKVEAAVRAEVEVKVTEAVRAEAEAKVTAAVQAGVEEQVNAAVYTAVRSQVIQAATGMDAAQYDEAVSAGLVDEQTQSAIENAIAEQMASDAVKEQIAANVSEQMASETVQNMIADNTELQMGSEDVQKTIAENVETQMSSDDVSSIITAKTDEQMASDDIKALISQNTEAQVQKAIADTMAGDEVQAKLAAASEGAKKVMDLKTSLDSYKAFYSGLTAYTAGVGEVAKGAAELSKGAEDLSSGTGSLASGAGELYSGAAALKDVIPALTDGVTQLKNGSWNLYSGLVQFNTDGVQKLVSAVDDDLEGFVDKLQAVKDAAKLYDLETSDDTDPLASLKYIYRTEEIK